MAGDPDLLQRVRIGHLPVGYSWLTRWEKLRKEAAEAGAAWPMPESRKAVSDAWVAVAKGVEAKPWTRITLLNEGGLTPDKWAAKFAADPVEPAKK